MSESLAQFRRRLEELPIPARRLLCLIAQQAQYGTLRSKDPGIATMPELHEACGLGVDQMYSLLHILRDAQLILIEGAYPFEEIRLTEASPLELLLKQCESAGIPIQNVVVNLRFDLVSLPAH